MGSLRVRLTGARVRGARLISAGVIAAALVLTGAGAALATDPVTLGSSRVLDESGVLSSSEASSVDSHLREVSADAGVDLWVVYVPEFTGEGTTDRWAWADAVAEGNGLGKNQYLLAIATDARQYALSGAQEGPVSWDQLDVIEQERVGPALQAGDWAGAATTAADGLADAAGGGSGGAPSEGGGSFVPILIGLLVVAAIVVVIVLVVRSRRKKTAVTGPPSQDALSALSTKELGRRASSALVATDDAIKTSEQELGFARAQFGDDAAREFEATIAQAKTDIDEAFSLKQKLEDAEPDTEEEIRAWNAKILELCAHANDELDAKAADFDELRKLEQNAPEALARTQELRGTVGTAHDAATATLTTLQASYAPAALATVADNPQQAAQLLSFADEHLAAAQRAIGAGNGAEAAVEIRGAEDAVGQAKLLHTAIDKLAADLAAAEQQAAALITDIEGDIAGAAALRDEDGRLAAVVASTRQQVDAAKALLGAAGKQPVAALQTLDKANNEIDTVIVGIRTAQQQAAHAAQQLNALIVQAQSQVSAAEDFITSRRGAVGADARTRLAEAGAALVQARQLAATDPVQALPSAQRANSLAAQAIQLAQNDVGGWGGGGQGGGGGDLMGAVLGGIVINSLLSGGRGGRGGFGGGGMFGGGSRPSGGGFGGGGRGPGSFGGGGTRGRRGGGRF